MRELHIGRLIDHIHLRARDLAATKRFYRAVLEALDKPIGADYETHLADETADPCTGTIARWRRTCIWRFRLAIRMPCGAFTKRARRRRAGQRRPRRAQISPGYFGAFLLDPDGNNVEA